MALGKQKSASLVREIHGSKEHLVTLTIKNKHESHLDHFSLRFKFLKYSSDQLRLWSSGFVFFSSIISTKGGSPLILLSIKTRGQTWIGHEIFKPKKSGHMQKMREKEKQLAESDNERAGCFLCNFPSQCRWGFRLSQINGIRQEMQTATDRGSHTVEAQGK